MRCLEPSAAPVDGEVACEESRRPLKPERSQIDYRVNLRGYVLEPDLAKPHQGALVQSVETRLRGLHVGSFKALAEAIIHRLQKAACIGDPTLIMRQACKVCGCSQLS